MSFLLQPWQLLACIVGGYANRELQHLIDYLRTENAILKEKLGPGRLRLNDDQRRRLAEKGKPLGRKLLASLGTLVTPDTILRWHKHLVAQKWNYIERRKKAPGRPPVTKEIQELILRLTAENPSWGYDRIQGALANLDHMVSDRTVGNVLKRHGVDPAAQRKRQTTWATFLKAHGEGLASTDFTTVEVWTKKGLTTFYLLFVMELATRRVQCVGITTNPDESWMKQMARNLTAFDDGFWRQKRYVLMDRDTNFSAAFRRILVDSGAKPVLLPPRSPNLNAHLERFWRSLREECLDRLIFFGEDMLRRSLSEYLAHDHGERNHQGLENRLIDVGLEVVVDAGSVECRERLGGVLRYYYRQAA